MCIKYSTGYLDSNNVNKVEWSAKVSNENTVSLGRIMESLLKLCKAGMCLSVRK